jgi:hypothetical protein
MADELNGGGYGVQDVLAKGVQRDWDKEAVMSLLFKPLYKAITGKSSTTQADRAEYSKVCDKINLHLGELFGIFTAWPSNDAGDN